jgi:hypothetical protein
MILVQRGWSYNHSYLARGSWILVLEDAGLDKGSKVLYDLGDIQQRTSEATHYRKQTNPSSVGKIVNICSKILIRRLPPC